MSLRPGRWPGGGVVMGARSGGGSEAAETGRRNLLTLAEVLLPAAATLATLFVGRRLPEAPAAGLAVAFAAPAALSVLWRRRARTAAQRRHHGERESWQAGSDARLAAQQQASATQAAALGAALQQARSGRTDRTDRLRADLAGPLKALGAVAARVSGDERPSARDGFAALAARLVPDLLESLDEGLGEGEPGVRAPRTLSVDLAEIAEDVAALLWPEAASRGLDLAAYVDPATPHRVAGDPARLRQALFALTVRALEATLQGGVLIEVEPDQAGSVRLSVHDTSRGVPGGEIAGVFAAHPGLAACRAWVEAAGGRVHVTSDAARGSTFAFRLPVEVLEPAKTWPAPARRGDKALLLCAGLSTRRALARYLARSGYGLAQAGEPVALVVGEPDALGELRRDGVPRACLTSSGMGAAETLRLAGATQADLVQPFRRADLGRFLQQVAAGAFALGRPAASTPRRALYGGEPLIDEDVAGQLAAMTAAGRGAFVQRVQALYRDNAPDSVANLAGAVEALDPDGAARAAHALRSMSHNVGARVVARMAGDMESSAREGRPPAPAAVEELGRVLQQTLAVLNDPPETPAGPLSATDLSPREAELIGDLQAAVAADQLSLAYQPQVDRDGERVVGVEALLRWAHPTRGSVSPALFIPLAEKAGLIGVITTWVVDRLLAETRYLTGLQVAFNASAIEFADPGFVDRLQSLIGHHGYDARRLEVEITETAILQNEERVRQTIDRLRALGMRVALDDFGAGHSSLSHLRRYPFDKLKIDREFVTDCSRDMQSATVVHAVVSIGRALGMKVVAEGVETDTQSRFLKVAGVHAMQGFLFGKAIGIDELSLRVARPRLGAAG